MKIDKKRFTDADVDCAIRYCRDDLHMQYWDLSYVYIYRWTVSNKNLIQHMEVLANNCNHSLIEA